MAHRVRSRKNYHQWILDHKDEILSMPNKDRTDWVMNKFKVELGLDMKRYNVYQLLYRNGLINHKNEIEIITTSTTDEILRQSRNENIDSTQEESDAISLGPCDEEYLHQKIFELFGVYCPIEDEDPFGYGD